MTGHQLAQISKEIREALLGRKLGRIFTLGRNAIAIDFVPHAGTYLYIDTSGRYRSVYLIVRKSKVIERSTTNPSRFHLRLRDALAGSELVAVTTVRDGICLGFNRSDELRLNLYALVNSHPADLVLVTGDSTEIDSASGQAPDPTSFLEENADEPVPPEGGDTVDLSKILDERRIERDRAELLDRLAADARRQVKRDLGKRQKLFANLEKDLLEHGDPEVWKRYGDLILANLPEPKRAAGHYNVIDLFDTNLPAILISDLGADDPKTCAEQYFRKYRKASTAMKAITERKSAVQSEIESLLKKLDAVERAIDSDDHEYLKTILEPRNKPLEKQSGKRRNDELKGVRRFASESGFEILVGKKAVDNDNLTFRIARSLDLWLHAADYPGSHVIIRAAGRKEIPHSTIVEAASIAAFYSTARELPKAAVNYTQRRFVNKPRKAAPGLVSLSAFKTILVRPEVPATITKIDI